MNNRFKILINKEIIFCFSILNHFNFLFRRDFQQHIIHLKLFFFIHLNTDLLVLLILCILRLGFEFDSHIEF